MFNNLNLYPNMSPNMMNMMNMNIMMNNMNMMKNMNMNMMMNNLNNMKNMGMNQNYSTLKRLKREYELCSNDKDLPENIGTSFDLIEGNYYKWRTTIIGPKDTPYEDGLFFIKIIFPEDYPKHGAEFKFINKIYHSNVDWRKDLGHISISTLNAWRSFGKVSGKRCYGVKKALFDIYYMFLYRDVIVVLMKM